MIYIDMAGQKLNNLLVISRAENTTKGRARWLCQCDCGKMTVVEGWQLRSGGTKSCGCLQRASVVKRNTKHMLSKTPAYRVWKAMIKRCYNPKATGYKNYGGRGIYVEPEYHDPVYFITELGQPPTEKHSLGRIDNDKNYGPGNCRWETKQEQGQNTRRTRLTKIAVAEIRHYRVHGVTLRTLAEEYGANISTIHAAAVGKSWKDETI